LEHISVEHRETLSTLLRFESGLVHYISSEHNRAKEAFGLWEPYVTATRKHVFSKISRVFQFRHMSHHTEGRPTRHELVLYEDYRSQIPEEVWDAIPFFLSQQPVLFTDSDSQPALAMIIARLYRRRDFEGSDPLAAQFLSDRLRMLDQYLALLKTEADFDQFFRFFIGKMDMISHLSPLADKHSVLEAWGGKNTGDRILYLVDFVTRWWQFLAYRDPDAVNNFVGVVARLLAALHRLQPNVTRSSALDMLLCNKNAATSMGLPMLAKILPMILGFSQEPISLKHLRLFFLDQYWQFTRVVDLRHWSALLQILHCNLEAPLDVNLADEVVSGFLEADKSSAATVTVNMDKIWQFLHYMQFSEETLANCVR